jgi:hypothetical protein
MRYRYGMKTQTYWSVLGLAAMTWGGVTAGHAAESAQAGRLEHFITRRGNKLMDGDKVFRFIGAANTDIRGYCQSPWYDVPPTEYELRDAFETMRQMGQQAVRTYTFGVRTSRESDIGHIAKHVIGPRVYNEEAFRSFDKMLQIADEYGIRVIVPFLDQHDFGSNKDAFARMHGKGDFYRQAREEYKTFVTDVVTRRNTFTGRLYKDEKAVLAWQLGNELGPPADWESEMAAHLKKVAPNHLVASALRGLHANSIRDPNLDIIDYHPYPGPPNDIRGYENVARQGKVVIFGEFGGKGGAAAVKPFLDKVIASDIAGANFWAVVPRYRWGGYGRFHFEGHQGYSRLHWPWWDRVIEKKHDVAGVLTVLQDAAFKLQGQPVPKHRVPVPKAPELLPIDNPLRISWRGPTGARWYEIQRADDPKGAWKTVGDKVIDHGVPGWFGSIFADKEAPKGVGFYRVRAANEAGVSPWSNIVEVGAPHPVMTEMYLGPNLLENWTFEDGAKGWAGIDGTVAQRTRARRFSGAHCVELANAKNHAISQTVKLKPNTHYLWFFYYRNEGDGRLAGRVLAGDGQIAHFDGRRSNGWMPWSLHFHTGTNEDLTLAIVCTGPKFHIDDCVLVENPQWVTPADRKALRPAYGWSGGGQDTHWSNPVNWDRKGIPGPGDTVHHRRRNTPDEMVVDRDVTIANAWVHWDGTLTRKGEFYRATWADDGHGRTMTITDSVRIMNAGRVDARDWTDASVSELILKNLNVRIGTQDKPAELLVAFDQSASRQSPRVGRLTVQGGSVRAWLTYLGIGRELGSDDGPRGFVDLRRCSDVAIHIVGDADLGHMSTWEGSYHTGELRCGGGTVAVGGDLHLADTRDNGNIGVGSAGRLHLVNTRFAVAGKAVFSGRNTLKGQEFARRYAEAFITVDGQCSGLDLRNKAADALAFTFGKQNVADAPALNRIVIAFKKTPPQPDADGWIWGLRWAGDHVAALRGYLSEEHPRLRVDVSPAPEAAKAAHLAHLRKLAPGTYAQRTVASLRPADYVVYDARADKTYAGIYAGEVKP